MQAIAYSAGLLAAVFWGVSPIVSKRGLSHGGGPMSLAVVAIATATALFWAVLLVTAGPTVGLASLSAADVGVFVVAGVVGSAAGRVASFTGIDRVGASVNSAVVATNPLFATGLAVVFLGELVTARQALGVVVVVAGLVALTLSRGGDLSGWTASDLAFPLVAAIAYGAGGVVRRYGLTATAATPLEGAALNEAAALVALVAYLVARRRAVLGPTPRRALAYFVGTGVLSGLGLLMLFYGLDHGKVAIVVTLSGTATLFTTLFSTALLGDLERVTRGVVAGSVLVVAGIVLVTAP